MLKPALLYKDELLKKFAAEMYSDRYFLYSGYANCHELPKIDSHDDEFQYAIVDSHDNVLGWFAYRVYLPLNSVENFGLYSFGTNWIIGKDVFTKMEELVQEYHRVSWRVIEGNPVKKHYDKFCEKHNGRSVFLRDVTIDNHSLYRGEYIYEIIQELN